MDNMEQLEISKMAHLVRQMRLLKLIALHQEPPTAAWWYAVCKCGSGRVKDEQPDGIARISHEPKPLRINGIA
jgi:hypothetical protein